MNRDKAILKQIIDGKKKHHHEIMLKLNQVNNPFLRNTLFEMADNELSEIRTLESMYETMLFETNSTEWHTSRNDVSVGRYVFFRGF